MRTILGYIVDENDDFFNLGGGARINQNIYGSYTTPDYFNSIIGSSDNINNTSKKIITLLVMTFCFATIIFYFKK
jgi:hypothetical protein